MDVKVAWSPEATEDLEAIADYIARDAEFYARAVVTEILSVSRNIGEFPLIGRVVPEIGEERIRERFVYSYRVAVIHGKRLLENVTGLLGRGT